MHTLLMTAGMILKETGSLMLNNVYWLLLLVIIFIYRRSANLEYAMLGSRFPVFQKLSGSVLIGLMGGLIGSLLVVFLGIIINDYMVESQGVLYSGILYIWVIALLLALINPRYLCFSYAGGIVALMNLLTGFPSIYVPGLLALIGILHLVESFLIWLDGHTCAVPIFLKRKNGAIVGGFMMNRIWAIPLIVLAIGLEAATGNILLDSGGMIVVPHMPVWWPVIKLSGSALAAHFYAYFPLLVPVVLGYGDMAVTRSPEKRCSDSAQKLAMYSVALTLLAVLSSISKVFGFIAALFAPIVHELLIIQGKREEEEGEPAFGPSEDGVKVLYTSKNSPSEKMKLESGDTILSINNICLEDERQLEEFLSGRPPVIWLQFRKNNGELQTAEYSDYRNGIDNIGALVVPRHTDLYFEINEGGSFAKGIINRLRNRKK